MSLSVYMDLKCLKTNSILAKADNEFIVIHPLAKASGSSKSMEFKFGQFKNIILNWIE